MMLIHLLVNTSHYIYLNVNVFLTSAFSVYAEVIQYNADNAVGEDSDEFIVGATARF